MVDHDVLRQKINVLEENISKLNELAALPLEIFLGKFYYVDAGKHLLQTSIEAMLDISQHIIARRRFRNPQTDAEAFTILVEQGILPAEKEADLRNMAKFRNRVVHLYHDVDDREVYQLLAVGAKDGQEFVAAIVAKLF